MLIAFILTFRVGIINEYTFEVRAFPSLKIDFDVTYNVDRYPFLLVVNDPYTFYVFVKTREETINAKINYVKINLKDKKGIVYNHKKLSKIVPIDKQGLNFVLKNFYLPAEDVELKMSVTITTTQGESDYLIQCRLIHQRKIELGNYLYDRIMAI